jgi:hypothetical protein
VYTVEVWKQDRRTLTGLRMVHKADYDTDNLSMLEHTVRQTWPLPKFQVLIRQTWVNRRNALTGEEFLERYDQPYATSPSSEAYWSR